MLLLCKFQRGQNLAMVYHKINVVGVVVVRGKRKVFNSLPIKGSIALGYNYAQ